MKSLLKILLLSSLVMMIGSVSIANGKWLEPTIEKVSVSSHIIESPFVNANFLEIKVTPQHRLLVDATKIENWQYSYKQQSVLRSHSLRPTKLFKAAPRTTRTYLIPPIQRE